MEVTVIRPGMLTTLQDRGRPGSRAQGVPLGGAADPWALRVANLLVGNPEGAVALECTLIGPELEFSADVTVAIGGAEFAGAPRWRPMRVRAGQRLALGAAKTGCRGYLAIAGGFDVPEVLGGRGTYLRAALGGQDGRALREGDRLRVKGGGGVEAAGWSIDERILPAYGPEVTVRVVRGAQADELNSGFWDSGFKVSAKSDRMGVRLTGPAVTRTKARELRSSVVAPGTIQVPPDGQPIVLLADAQTVGGYPQAAHVVTVDLPLVAQLRPGDTVRFREIRLEEAHALLRAQERRLGLLREGLAQKFSAARTAKP